MLLLLQKTKTSLHKKEQNGKKQISWCSYCRKATELGIKTVVFDRGGNLYHGRVKAVAEGAEKVAYILINLNISLSNIKWQKQF